MESANFQCHRPGMMNDADRKCDFFAFSCVVVTLVGGKQRESTEASSERLTVR